MRHLSIRNLTARPGRTIALGLLIVFLSMALFGGSVMVRSLNGGLASLEARLGADVIVVPSSAKSSTNLDYLFLQGTTGYYYMDTEKAQKIAQTEGVERASFQIFMASLRASCCSMPVQVIGIDQDTDFTIQPWIEESFGRRLGDLDVLVGSKVNAGIGESIRIYNTDCPVVGRLAATGTTLDTGVFCTVDTVRLLLHAASELGHDLKISGDPENVVSAVYLKVKDGVDVQSVADRVNVYVRKVEAVRTRSYITGIADSLGGVEKTIRTLIVCVWILAFLILMAAFTMLTGERKKEFAVLRVIGMSRGKLAWVLLKESLLLSLFGGVIGIVLGGALTFSFQGLIEEALSLPFLMPGVSELLLLAIMTLVVVMLVGPMSSAVSAWKLSRVDIGRILREGI
ncbi:MAG: FtsX-like permease family protein [Clostridia bacterium]|nr:FtsX-like permease family protein [Clostridia bacterium]